MNYCFMRKDNIIARISTQIQRRTVNYFITMVIDVATDGYAESMINAEMITDVTYNMYN